MRRELGKCANLIVIIVENFHSTHQSSCRIKKIFYNTHFFQQKFLCERNAYEVNKVIVPGSAEDIV